MPPSLIYTNPNSDHIELYDAANGLHLRGLSGMGAVDGIAQAVTTPGRDGETYIRTVLPARFVVCHQMLSATSAADLWDLRRELLAVINPKLGVGELAWTPTAGGDTYLIDAIYESGAGLDVVTPRVVYEFALSFRCPDPAWRVDPANESLLVVPSGGLSIPLSVPMAVSTTTVTEVIDNDGDLDSYPVITAQGPITGLTVTNETTGKLVSFPGLVVAGGQTLTIDNAARTATVDGANVMPYRSADSQAWGLAPGNNTITATTSIGGTTVTLEWWTRLLGV